MRSAWSIVPLLLLLWPAAQARTKSPQHEPLADYIARMEQQSPVPVPETVGSLWTDTGTFSNFAADYKAMHVGDLITIVVAQGLSASNTAAVSTSRTLNANSGITALAGKLNTGGVQQLFSANSASALNGKSQGSTSSSLTDTLSGRVMAVLPTGTLVIEAERQLTMNNEKQTIVLRGLVRRGDIDPTGAVPSNAIANLELELKGKGVLSDGVRPPNPLVRAILWLVGF